jgi:putative ABC transport system ATP-binding protein
MIASAELSYQYSNGKAIQFPDLRLKKGDQCLLLGDSGSGKTTFLHLLGGLLRCQKGTITINDTQINILSESALDHFRGKNIGFIFQRNHLISSLSVEHNLLLSPYLAELKQDRTHISEVLSLLGIREKQNSKVRELSQGQAQRVAIARAVLNKPSIILADEPTSALDDKNCERVIDILMDVALKNGATLIIATHDQRLKHKVTNYTSLK